MRAGRIHRFATRGVVALVLGWAAVMVGSLLVAPSASAAPAATVYIRDLTPPLVSVDKNGTVTFINQIQDKSTGVSLLGLSALTATVHTDVTLAVPSGKYTLASQPDTDPNPEQGSSVAEKFAQSCVTCTITYGYRVTFSAPVAADLVGQLTGQALQKLALPQSVPVTYNNQQITVTIGVPTPFIVNTLLPLPNLPSVNLPQVPQVTVPSLGGTTIPQDGGTVPGTQTITTTTTTGTTPQSVPGTQYTYDTGAGAPQMAPVDTAASAAFDPSRFGLQSAGSNGASGSGRGSGGLAGQYDGATVPVFGQLAGLNGSDLQETDSAAASPGSASAPALPVPALAAVVALAAVTAALVRTHQAHRAAQQLPRGR
jgi:hypothetical protein